MNPTSITELRSVFTLPSSGRVLIEANAGTGKTYTIQGLFLKLLLEHDLRADRILVVTYTRMATHELRSRIMSRLQDALDALLHPDPEEKDPFLLEFLQWVPDREAAVLRIRRALQDSSQLSIFTIHGFCQKLLKDHPRHTSSGPEFEVVESDVPLDEVVQDWWRDFHARVARSPNGSFEASVVSREIKDADELRKRVKPYLDLNRVSEIEPGDSDFDSEDFLQRLHQVRQEMVAAYQEDRDGTVALLRAYTHHRYIESRIRDLMPMFESIEMPASSKNEDKLKYLLLVKESHPFFDRVQTYRDLVGQLGRFHSRFLIETARQIEQRYRIRRQRSRELRFQDLLELAWESICSKDSDGEFARIVRETWPIALVDEFQDTDPMQFQLFKTVYPAARPEATEPGGVQSRSGRSHQGEGMSGLFMIGDPKQSIYSFRGADVFTYLDARSSVPASDRYTLRKNYRSRQPLISAVNRLMDTRSFMADGIRFVPSEAGKALPPMLIEGIEAVPLRITHIPAEKKTTKDKVTRRVRVELVRQVAELLAMMQKGDVRWGDTRLRASDIAILSRTNQEVLAIEKELARWGISCVTLSKKSVFESLEARMFMWLLEALLDPLDHVARRNALATGLFGWEPEDVSDDGLTHHEFEFIDRLHELRSIWVRRGAVALVETILIEQQGILHLSRQPTAERSITNLRQIADAMERTRLDPSRSAPAMLHWLKRRIQDPDSSTEEEESRLETDENLVRVLTIHKSKGLEFPIVFCPDLWQAASAKKGNGFIVYHDPDSGLMRLNHHEPGSDYRLHAEKMGNRETQMESVRTAYVALTRASVQCRVLVTDYTARNPVQSGLLTMVRASAGKESAVGDSSLSALLRERAADSNGLIEFDEAGPTARVQPVQGWQESDGVSSDDMESGPHVRPYRGPEDLTGSLQWIQSYSRLTGSMPHPSASEPDPDETEAKMDDENISDMEERNPSAATPNQTQWSDRFNLPVGKQLGTMIHELLEDPLFRFDLAPDHQEEVDMVSRHVESHGFDASHVPVLIEILHDIRSLSCHGLTLCDVKPEDQIREMQFHLHSTMLEAEPLLSAIRSRTPTPDVPFTGRGSEAHHNGSAAGEEPGAGSAITHYLTGFIDLVVRHQGRYYILDYKSNHLGDNLTDYAPENLHRQSRRSRYDLQYHLYTVALFRYLRLVDPDFNPGTDFGGVLYLYLRGLSSNGATGVLFDIPDPEAMRQLETLILP